MEFDNYPLQVKNLPKTLHKPEQIGFFGVKEERKR